MSLSMMTPLISLVSSKDPPTFPSTLINSKSTSLRAKSATESTASTAILGKRSPDLETLDHNEVTKIQPPIAMLGMNTLGS